MIQSFFEFASEFENFFWGWFACPAILLIGIYFTVTSGFSQIRYFPVALRNFYTFLKGDVPQSSGVHPLKTFFASVGGCVGIGNVVAVCTAVQLGGPGALLWVWIAAALGMLVKYAELFLGMRYRVTRPNGHFSGGPMYFLAHAYKWSWIPSMVALLLCVYGVEIYQFSVVTKSLSFNLGLNEYLVAGVLLLLVVYAGRGGVQRVGGISSFMIPVFFLLFIGMGLWVLWMHIDRIPSVLAAVFTSAFTGHAAVGGFAGSSMIMAASQGIRRACYSGDLGVGYASVIHSESRIRKPEKQAALAFVEIFFDSFMICTMSILIILVTGVWSASMDAELLVQTALSMHFPYMNFFMPLFLTLLGYSTIIAYFCVGLKCAQYLNPQYGRRYYYIYSVIVLPLFSFLQTSNALSIMAITQAALLVINLIGIYRLRNTISFDVQPVDLEKDMRHDVDEEQLEPAVAAASKLPMLETSA